MTRENKGDMRSERDRRIAPTRNVSEALDSWRRLSWRQRREIVKLARGGRAHPDPRIARIAHDWALAVAPPRDDAAKWRELSAGALFGLLLDILLAPLGGAGGQATGGALGGGLRSFRIRRAAVQIQRAASPDSK